MTIGFEVFLRNLHYAFLPALYKELMALAYLDEDVSAVLPKQDVFLTSLRETKTISAITFTVYNDSLPNAFMLFAGRTSDMDVIDMIPNAKGFSTTNLRL